MKRLTAAGLAAMIATAAIADNLHVTTFDYYGPYTLAAPLMIDSVDVKGKKFIDANLSKAPETLRHKGEATRLDNPSQAPGHSQTAAHIIGFTFENAGYATPEVAIEGIKDYTLYLDGKKVDGNKLTLRPATHRLDIRYLTTPDTKAEPLKVELKSDNDAVLTLRNDGMRRFTLDDVLHGTNIQGTSISPDGKYLISNYGTTRRGGKSSYFQRVTSLADGHVVKETSDRIGWMPQGSSYWQVRNKVDGAEIVATDATTGAERVICDEYPQGASVDMTPDGKSLILTTYQDGREEDPRVYEIIQPEDRQPGWRSRSSLSILDLATGVIRPLTFGNRNVFLQDISDDSRHLLISTSESRLTKRPTTIFSIYDLDLATMKADTLVSGDGFIGQAMFSPDGKQVLLTGFPEALNGIGKNVPEGRIPSMIDNQLFLMDRATKRVTPMTRDFNPCVASMKWSRADNQIYFTAEDRDRVSLFRLNPANGKITAIATPEEVIGGFSVPDTGRTMVWYGESASAPRSLYTLDTKTLKSTRLATPKGEMLADVKLGVCEPWDFVNSRGDTINGRFYLPPDFDPAKKYPMIVNYYGGCSPTSRNFESRYPHNAYAAQGYVVYVINPSGTTGFGQEFSSRHVNTAGEGVAQDIIEGTKKFCQEHPFVNADKIGCIGASYGGFMTQYLQTVTDIFAAAISHAGISDHTSYWGEGYWGYSYSEVSMAESYPWKDADLYVKQSPLYNADKIHTPLLFLHGDKDNNVPVGESIQMFTALKLLDRPTAFVAVADQDHHILDYDKRIKWQDTIFAWFDRYLKDDPSWWNALYPPTPLK